MAIMSFILGVMIVLIMFYIELQKQIKEYALLKLLGLEWSQLLKRNVIYTFFLATTSGLVGILACALISYGLSFALFDQAWIFPLHFLWKGFLVVILLTMICSTQAIRPLYRTTPRSLF
jgi:ABC-type antimicrobial peptide transport system permease subunit